MKISVNFSAVDVRCVLYYLILENDTKLDIVCLHFVNALIDFRLIGNSSTIGRTPVLALNSNISLMP